MPDPDAFTPQFQYVVLIFALFVVPRLLQRYRLPSAVTSVALGALAGPGMGLFVNDATVFMLATLGIVSLFLFAGLEVDFHELRAEASIVGQHLLIGGLLLVGGSVLVGVIFDLPVRSAALTGLALCTPSVGFILDSLGSLGLDERERFWIKSLAVSTELLALAVLFVALQTVSVPVMVLSSAVLVAMVWGLPWLFRLFAAVVVPHAPKSEFAFLLMVAVLCSFTTKKLGVYYLVGAFVAGVTAQSFREHLPDLTSEKMLHAVEVFASFFVPFYFFRAGLQLKAEEFGLVGLGLGLAFIIVGVPVRVAIVALHRRLALGEPLRAGGRVGVSMVPTLVFTLVIARILRDRFAASPSLFGGLVVYALANALIPGIVLRAPAPEFGVPHAPPVDNNAQPEDQESEEPTLAS